MSSRAAAAYIRSSRSVEPVETVVRVVPVVTTDEERLPALVEKMTEADGTTPDKQGNTVQDRKVAAFSDVFRYGTWPFFSLSEADESGRPLEVKFYA